MSDKRFAVVITLFAVIGISLAVAMLAMVLNDEKVHSDGTSSRMQGGGPPLRISPLTGD
jgi:hypothetical protein